jgi:hypothetical protein
MRKDRLAEPDDAGKPVLPRPHAAEQVLSYLLLDGPVDVAARTQFTQRASRGCAGVASAGVLRLVIALHTFDSMSL